MSWPSHYPQICSLIYWLINRPRTWLINNEVCDIEDIWYIENFQMWVLFIYVFIWKL